MSVTRVFISHAHQDLDDEWVHQFTSRLRNDGYDIWDDATSLRPGADWSKEVEQELRHSSVFLMVLTPDALSSQSVRLEFTLAQSMDKPILGVIQKPVAQIGHLAPYPILDVSNQRPTSAAEKVLRLLIPLAQGEQPADAHAIIPLDDNPNSVIYPRPLWFRAVRGILYYGQFAYTILLAAFAYNLLTLAIQGKIDSVLSLSVFPSWISPSLDIVILVVAIFLIPIGRSAASDRRREIEALKVQANNRMTRHTSREVLIGEPANHEIERDRHPVTYE